MLKAKFITIPAQQKKFELKRLKESREISQGQGIIGKLKYIELDSCKDLNESNIHNNLTAKLGSNGKVETHPKRLSKCAQRSKLKISDLSKEYQYEFFIRFGLIMFLPV